MSEPTAPKKVLILHIEVPGVYADDLEQSAANYADCGDDPTPQDYLDVVRPGEKCMNDDFEIHAYTGRIVGAEVRDGAP